MCLSHACALHPGAGGCALPPLDPSAEALLLTGPICSDPSCVICFGGSPTFVSPTLPFNTSMGPFNSPGPTELDSDPGSSKLNKCHGQN